MNQEDIKSWDLVWSGATMRAVWIDKVSGTKVEAPIYITPDGKFRVHMPHTGEDVQ